MINHSCEPLFYCCLGPCRSRLKKDLITCKLFNTMFGFSKLEILSNVSFSSTINPIVYILGIGGYIKMPRPFVLCVERPLVHYTRLVDYHLYHKVRRGGDALYLVQFVNPTTIPSVTYPINTLHSPNLDSLLFILNLAA